MKNKLLLLLAGVMLISSCTDKLDQTPINAPTGKNFWINQRNAETFVSGCYAELRKVVFDGDGGMAPITYGDFPAKIFQGGEWGQNPMDGQFQWYADDYMGDWSKWYKMINSVCLAIEKIPGMDVNLFTTPEAKDQLLGEVKFLRGFTYFYMARIWGEFPLVTKSTTSASEAVFDVPYGTNNQIMDFCIKDLREAAPLLQWEKSTNTERAIRANRGSVYTFLAHMYLWKARPVFAINPDERLDLVREADKCLDSVILKGDYELQPQDSYVNIFKGKSIEGIFELDFDAGNKEAFGKSGFTTRLTGQPVLTRDQYRERPVFAFHPTFAGLFTAADKRKTMSFYNFGDVNMMITAKYQSIVFTNDKKTEWCTDDNWIFSRYADVLLLKAEVSERQGDFPTAKTYLNKVRERAGLGNYAGVEAGLKREILSERFRELHLEGQNLYDLVRTGLYTTFIPAYGGYDMVERYQGEGYYWPIQYYLMTRNKYARQTPYWGSRLP